MHLKECDREAVGVSAKSVSDFLMSEHFGKHELIEGSPNDRLAEIKFKRFGVLSISEHCFGCEAKLNALGSSENFHLQVVLSGESVVQSRGLIQRLRHGDSMMLAPHSSFTSTYSADCRKLIICIPASFIEQTAFEFGYRVHKGTIEFSFEKKRLPHSSSFICLLEAILQQPKDNSNDRGFMYYNKLLAHMVIGEFSCNLERYRQLPMSEHRLIERIRQHVLRNIVQDISIEDLSKVCRLSRKSIYNLCRRELGMTPLSYIRCLKLDSVYSELKQDDRVRNVTEVALKYGFTNLGRFSAQYKEYIGELPSQTFRKGVF